MPSTIETFEPVPLVGGISQQDESIAPETTVRAASNVIPDIAVGMRVRPGTVFDRKFTMAPNADVGIETWRWDSDELYFIVFGRGGGAPIFRIFRDGGNECAVTISGAATTYLSSGSAGSANMVPCPVDDCALLINNLVATSLIATDSYAIERHRPTYRDLVAFTTSNGKYLQTDEDDESADKGFYKQASGTYTHAHTNFETHTGSWTIHDGYWNDTNYYPCGFSIMFRRVALTGFTAATWTAATRKITKTNAFTGYTPRHGDCIDLSAGTGHTPGWYEIDTTAANDVSNLYLKANAGLAGADNADTAANRTDATYAETNICRIATRGEANVDFSTTSVASMHDIAYKLQQSLRNSGASGACVAWVPQSSGGAFQITSPYRGNNAIVYAPTAPTLSVGSSGDLTAAGRPFDPTTNIIVGGTGGAAPDGEDTSTPESRWTRVGASGQATGKPDPTTMPLKLSRTAANTFTLDTTTWTSRTAGDATSNPGPKVLTTGKKLADAVWHDNRLFLLGGPHIAGSRVSDKFDFFIADPTQVVDSDPIDKTVPGRQRGSLRFGVPWNDVLVLVHDLRQFEVTSGEQPLTPATASITPSTSQPGITLRPCAGASQLFFTSQGKDAAMVHEYFYDDIRASSNSQNVTGHVPTLLPLSPRAMAIVALSQTAIILPSSGASMYAYRWHYDQDTKVQSAWTKFDFDSGYRIVGLTATSDRFVMLVENTATYTVGSGALSLTITGHGYVDGNAITFSDSTTTPSVDGTKYVDVIDANTVNIYDDAGLTTPTTLSAGGTLRWNSGDFTLEKLSVSDTVAPTGWAHQPNMDRLLTLTGSYAAGKTTFTLPSTPTVLSGSAQFNGLGSTLNYIVLGPAFGASSGAVVAISEYGSTYVRVTGDYSAGSVMLGRYFDWSFVPTRAFPRNSRGRADIRLPIIVGTVTGRHKSTCSYRIEQTKTGMVTRYKDFDAGVTPSNGSLFTYLSGDPTQVTWTVKSVSSTKAMRPASIVSVQFEAESNPDSFIPRQ